jgi:hypothetical protein
MGCHDKKWNMRYEQLLKFKQNNGHCVVPKSYEQDKSLGMWVARQRNGHNNDKLRQDRKERLDEIGFAWKADDDHTFKPDDKLWHHKYEKLVEFKRKHGHCMVPQKKKGDVSLGMWVSHQRKNHSNNKMRQDRKERLDEIGFAWKDDVDAYGDKLWHQQYEKLVEYKRKHGNCLVPYKYKPDRLFGQWLIRQRTFHKSAILRLDRKQLLDALDFVWNAIGPAVRSSTSTSDVRGPLVIGSFHALDRPFF